MVNGTGLRSMFAGAFVGTVVAASLLPTSSNAQAVSGPLEAVPGFLEYMAASESRIRSVQVRIASDPDGYQALLSELTSRFGTAPMRSIGYLDDLGGAVGRSILAGAVRTGVDPTLLAVTAFQEGLNGVIDGMIDFERIMGQRVDPDQYVVDGFFQIGADSFAERMPDLKARGLLRREFDGVVLFPGVTATNEVGDAFPAFHFVGIPATLEGIGAMLSDMERRFERDARRNGIDLLWMTPSERDGWIYLYYNVGPGKGVRHLRLRRGRLPKPSGLHGQNPYFNAARVRGASEVYRRYGVFVPFGSQAARNVDTRPWRAPDGTSGGSIAGAGMPR